jgi:4a-hydroxytetrahydrobiopterin dehydratase
MMAGSDPDLTKKKCVPCEGGVPALTTLQSQGLIRALKGWTLGQREGQREISKEFVFKDFTEALRFVNRVGALAESEGHHPDIFLHQYKKVTITLWTHAVGGLTENDFIVAAKIDEG